MLCGRMYIIKCGRSGIQYAVGRLDALWSVLIRCGGVTTTSTSHDAVGVSTTPTLQDVDERIDTLMSVLVR